MKLMRRIDFTLVVIIFLIILFPVSLLAGGYWQYERTHIKDDDYEKENTHWVYGDNHRARISWRRSETSSIWTRDDYERQGSDYMLACANRCGYSWSYPSKIVPGKPISFKGTLSANCDKSLNDSCCTCQSSATFYDGIDPSTHNRTTSGYVRLTKMEGDRIAANQRALNLTPVAPDNSGATHAAIAVSMRYGQVMHIYKWVEDEATASTDKSTEGKGFSSSDDDSSVNSKYILITKNCVRITSAGDCVRVDSDGREYVLNEWYQDCPEGATEDNPEGCSPGIVSDFPEYDFDENVSSSEINTASSNSGGGDTVVTESGDIKGSTLAAIGTAVVGVTAVATQLLNLLAGAGASTSSPLSASSSTAAVSTAAKKEEGFSLDATSDGATGLADSALEGFLKGERALGGPDVSGDMRHKVYNKVLDYANKLSDYNALRNQGYDFLESTGLSCAQNELAGAFMDTAGDIGMKYLSTIEGFGKIMLPSSAQDILPSNAVKQYTQAGYEAGYGVYEGLSDAWEEYKTTGSLSDAAGEFKSTLGENVLEIGDKAKNKSFGLSLKGYAEASELAGEMSHVIEEKGVAGALKQYTSDIQLILKEGTWKDVMWEGAEGLAKEAKGSQGFVRGWSETTEIAGHVYGTLESKGVIEGGTELVSDFSEDLKKIYNHANQDEIIKNVSQSSEEAAGVIGKGVKGASQLAGEYFERGGGMIGGAKEFTSDCALILKNLWG